MQRITRSFPLIVTIFTILGLTYPQTIIWFKGEWITMGLAGIMLGMGLTLRASDFMLVVKNPKWVLTGLGLQFIVMPILGWLVAKFLELSPPFAVGIILVSCCPGGTASNVIAYLSKAEVALSLCMTAFSTLAAVFLTPFLTLQLSGSYLEIPTAGLFFSTSKVVLIPIILGVLLNQYLPKVISKVIHLAPPFAVILISLIVGSIVGQGKEVILDSGGRLLLGLIFLHFLGFLIGFIISWSVFKNWKVAKTISIEVGMQNSGLGVVLARENFTSPLVAVPAALSSLIHSLLGSFFVSIFKNKN